MTKQLGTLSRSINTSVAVVTGAASGMGRATAQLFADEGARVAVLDVNASALEGVAKSINDNGGQALAIVVDLLSRDAIGAAVRRVAEHFGGIDILINNAGFGSIAGIESADFEQVWDKSFAVMTTAQAWAIRAALPSLRNSENPRIVNIASTEALGASLRLSVLELNGISVAWSKSRLNAPH